MKRKKNLEEMLAREKEDEQQKSWRNQVWMLMSENKKEWRRSHEKDGLIVEKPEWKWILTETE